MSVGTAKNGSYFKSLITSDERFWRVVGLYLAEGHAHFDARRHGSWRVTWSFHPRNEEHLVDEVCALWLRHGVAPRVTTLLRDTRVHRVEHHSDVRPQHHERPSTEEALDLQPDDRAEQVDHVIGTLPRHAHDDVTRPRRYRPP